MLNDIKRINEEYWNGVYYCVVTTNKGAQYFKTFNTSVKDNKEIILDIRESGDRWKTFLDIVNNIKVENYYE